MHPASPEMLAAFAAAGDGASGDYITVLEDDSLWDVLAKMRAADASVALVKSKDGPSIGATVQGAITRKDILDTLADDMELFSG
jgi:CBS domain-containing protein